MTETGNNSRTSTDIGVRTDAVQRVILAVITAGVPDVETAARRVAAELEIDEARTVAIMSCPSGYSARRIARRLYK